MSTETVSWALRIEDAFSRVLDEAADAARRLRGAAEGAQRELDSMRRGGEKLASMVGGPIGDLADIIFDVGEAATGAGGAVGGLGVALGGAAVAAGALAFAGVGLASAAEAATKRLEEQGLAAMIPEESRQSVAEYREATAGLRNEVDALTAIVGGPAVDAVSSLALILSGAAGVARELAADLRSVSDALPDRPAWAETLGRVALAVGTLNNSELARSYSDLAESLLGVGEAAVEEQAAIQSAAASDLAVAQALAEAEAEEARRKRSAEEASRRLTQAREEAARAAEQERVATERLWASVDAFAAKWRDIDWQAPTIDLTGTAEAAGGLMDLSGIASLGGMSADAAGLLADRRQQAVAGILSVSGAGAGLEAFAGSNPLAGLEAIAGGGPLSGLASAGPAGLVVGAIVGLPTAIDGLAAGLDGMIAMFSDLPAALTTALGETLPAILRDLPDLAVAITEAALSLPEVLLSTLPEIVAGLVAALPELVIGVVQALIENLPQILMSALELTLSSIFLGGPFVAAVAEGLWEGFQSLIDQLPEGIANALQRLLYQVISPLSDNQGRFLGTDLRAEGGMSFLGVELPSFDRGSSEITRDGLALLHRGERIERDTGGVGAGGSRTVTINVNGVSDPREVVRLLYEHLGRDDGPTFAFGDRLGGG